MLALSGRWSSRVFCSAVLALGLSASLQAQTKGVPSLKAAATQKQSATATGDVLATVNANAASTSNSPVGMVVAPYHNRAYRLSVGPGGNGHVAMFSFDKQSGVLTSLGADMTAGSQSSSIAMDPRNRFVFVANSGDATVSVYAVQAGGTLSPVANSPFSTGSAPTQVMTDATGQFLYVLRNLTGNNLSAGASYIESYGVSASGQLSSLQSPVAVGAPTSEFALSQDGGFLYVASFSSSMTWATPGQLAVFPRSANGVVAAAVASISTKTPAPSTLAVNPVNGFIYVGEDPGARNMNPKFSGQEFISVYSFNATNPKLSPVTGSPYQAATPPNTLAFDPAGRYLYAAGSLYSADAGTWPGTVQAYPVAGNGALGAPSGALATGDQVQAALVDSSGHLLYVVNYGDSASSGSVSIYTTNAPVPVFTSTDLNNTQLSLKAALSNPLGLPAIQGAGFLYGLDFYNPQQATSLSAPLSANAFSAQLALQPLESDASYAVRPYAVTTSGARYLGYPESFVVARVLNDMATPVFSGGQLQLAASINNSYGQDVKATGFMVVATANPQTALVKLQGALSGNNFSTAVTLPLSLNADGPFSVRAFLTNSSGVTYLGKALPFDNTAVVSTGTVGAASFSGYALSGTVRSGLSFQGAGFAYGRSLNPVATGSTIKATQAGSSLSGELPLQALQTGGTYYVRAYAVMADGTLVYGGNSSFVNTPLLTNTSAAGLENVDFSATLLTGLTAKYITFLYGTSTAVSINDYEGLVSASSNSGAVTGTRALSLLKEKGKLYYVIASAIDSNDNIIYSNLTSFTNTPAVALAVSQVSSTNADYSLTIDSRVKNIRAVEILYMEGGVKMSATVPLQGPGDYKGSFGGLLLPNSNYNIEVRVYFNNSTNYFSSNIVPITTQAATLGQDMRGGKLVYLDASGQHGLVAQAGNANSSSVGLSVARSSVKEGGWSLPTPAQLEMLYNAATKKYINLPTTAPYWSSESCGNDGGCSNPTYQWTMLMTSGQLVPQPPTNKGWARGVKTF